jgi:hypothetical protein
MKSGAAHHAFAERMASLGGEELKRRVHQESWRGTNRLEDGLFVQGFVPPSGLLEGWIAVRSRVIEQPGWPRIARSMWQASAGGERLLRVDVHECDSREEAHDFLVYLLGTLQGPLPERDEEPPVGDVAFTLPRGRSSLFARANLVIAVLNAGPEVVPVIGPAERVDAEISSQPREAGEVVPRIERVDVQMGARRGHDALDVKVADPLGRHVWLKIFTRGGAVEREDGALLLRPHGEAPVEGTVFAVNENGGVASADFQASSG